MNKTNETKEMWVVNTEFGYQHLYKAQVKKTAKSMRMADNRAGYKCLLCGSRSYFTVINMVTQVPFDTLPAALAHLEKVALNLQHNAERQAEKHREMALLLSRLLAIANADLEEAERQIGQQEKAALAKALKAMTE